MGSQRMYFKVSRHKIGKGAVGGAAVAFLIESGDLFHGPRAAGLGSVPVPGQRQRQVGTAGVHLAAVANGGGTLGIALCSTCVIIVYSILPILKGFCCYCGGRNSGRYVPSASALPARFSESSA